MPRCLFIFNDYKGGKNDKMNVNNEDAKITKAYYDEVRMFEDIKRYLENLDSYEDSANDLKNYIDKVVECVKAKKKPFIEEIEDDDSSYTRMWLGRV